jgi:negative regulator of sigma E activity
MVGLQDPPDALPLQPVQQPPDATLDEALSAVMDGQATPSQWALVSAAWTHDPALRERWAQWHAAADGLRSAELPALHRDPEALLAGLHAQIPAHSTAEVVDHPYRRTWWAPAAVAASFIALAVGINTLRPPAAVDEVMATAPSATPRAQGLGGTSFAQTAAGRTLPSMTSLRDAGLAGEAPPDVIDWALDLPAAPASAVQP